jgi:hypothetical protein
VDFKKCLKSKTGYNIVAIFIDCLGKRPILVPVYNTITTRDLAQIFITHVIRYVSLPDLITSNKGL